MNSDFTSAADIRRRLSTLSPAQRAAIARKLSVLQSRPAAKSPSAAVSTSKDQPLSFAQERMWVPGQFNPANPVYNRPASLRLRGALDVPALEASLNELVRRHEILRSRICSREGRLTQTARAFEPVPLKVVELESTASGGVEDRLQTIADAEAQRLFNLEEEPPFRARLVRVSSNDHALLLTFHHVAFDGWSFAILWDDLASFYTAHLFGRPPALPDLPMQYADYAARQRKWLEGDVLPTQLAYWENRLAGCSGVLDMPSDRPRPAVQSHSGSYAKRNLPAGLAAALKELSRKENVTLFMALFAGLVTLLHRYTNQEDILIGVPVAGRTRLETERLIGCFINTLAIRTDASGNPTVRELLQRIRTESVDAFTYQEMPFEKLVGKLQADRDLSRLPLFQVLFQLRNTPSSAVEFPGLQVTPMTARTNTAKTDLNFDIVEEPTGITVDCEYDTGLFEASTVERLLAHYEILLCGMAADPSSRLGELPLLSGRERYRSLMEWNRTEREYPRDACLQQLFEQQVQRTPEAVAVIAGDQSLRYREVNEQANRVANNLRRSGIGSHAAVGIMLGRSIEFVVAVIGILKAGAAYVPLDAALPPARLRFMVRDAGVQMVIGCPSELSRELADDLALQPAWEALVEAEAGLGDIDPGPGSEATDVAYIMYTSGSTGAPKGVAVPHRAVSRLICGNDFFPFGPFGGGQIFALLAHTGFDASTLELWGPLLHGSTLAVFPEGALELDRLQAFIERQRVTCLWLTAALFNAIVDERPETLAGVRNLAIGGEALSVRHVRRALQMLPATQITNGYGPTEGTTFTTTFPIPRELPADAQTVPIGRPIANTQVYLLDRHLNPVPIGVAGEIHIGGDGLACGYVNSPEQTAEKFIPNPFKPGTLLYRTGDLGRYLPDGNIAFLGRLDRQVKIRGFRIELGEIEAALSGHPSLMECAVVARENEAGEKYLTGFVVARVQGTAPAQLLREWLTDKLPDYMIPSRFVELCALPLTPNGKLDHAALDHFDKELDKVDLVSGTGYTAPRNERESKLAGIWQAVLRQDRVGIHDNFFDLGGHSLLAVHMVSHMRSLLCVETPPRWVFEHPTIERLAKKLESVDVLPADIRPIERLGRQYLPPMSFAQQGMWLLQQMLPDPATYNVAVACSLSGRVDRKRMVRALEVIVERHEVMRTRLVLRGENMVQHVAAVGELTLPWRESDLQRVPPGRQQAVLEERLVEEARRPFDLAEAPLWRSLWMTLAEDEHVLAFVFHHSIMDEWSLGLFFEEWERLYTVDGGLEPAGLPVLSVQYADYAAWQRQRLEGELLEQQRTYWTEQLQDLQPAMDLPTDMPRPDRPSGRGAVHEFQFKGAVVVRLRELAHEESTTLFTVLLAAFQVWLYRCTGRTDVVVCVPAANRERAEVQALLGLFLNTLPIRVQLEGSLGFREVLRRVRETVWEALRHADLPFEQIVGTALRKHSSASQSLSRVMFVLLEEGLPDLHLEQVEARLTAVRTRTSKNDLTLMIRAVDDGWDCQFEYATDLFTAQTIERMSRHLRELLGAIADDPEKSIRALDLLPNEFVWLDRLPLTPNGKVDHAAMPVPQTSIEGTAPPAMDQPGNLLELELIRLWQKLFKRQDIGRRDDFFSLGGNSLLAARLAGKIDKLLGSKLPIAALFQSPTVESLARRLAGESLAPRWSSLVPLKPLGSKPPFFIIHGWGGDLFGLVELAKLLAVDQPAYGLQAVELDGKSTPHLSIENMAAHYVEEICSFQTEGPYYLGGYSMGGLIAFEVAQQLHRLGKRVALLALLDSGPLGTLPWAVFGRIMLSYIRGRCWLHLKRWSKMPRGDRSSYFWGRWAAVQGLLARNVAKPPLAAAPRKTSRQHEGAGADDHYFALAKTYQLRPYPGSVDVFTCKSAGPRWTSCWRHFARGGVSLHPIPGGHTEIFTPDYLPALATALSAALQRVHQSADQK